MSAERRQAQPVRPADPQLVRLADVAARRAQAAALLLRLGSDDVKEQAQARQLFFKDGHFEDARLTLRISESAEERANAARALGIVGSRQSTALLIAALFDPASEVRCAAAEALSRIGDPAVARAPLQALAAAENLSLLSQESASGRAHQVIRFWRSLSTFQAAEWQMLSIAVHVFGAIAFAISGAFAVQFLILPFWFGGLLGVLLYTLIIFLDQATEHHLE